MPADISDEGVSPVIGVILLVAITVILAAVIAAFVFGYATGMEKHRNIAVTVDYWTDGTTDYVYVVYQGGKDNPYLDTLTVSSDFCPAPVTVTKPAVGTSFKCALVNPPDIVPATVTAKFIDNTQTVIWQGNL